VKYNDSIFNGKLQSAALLTEVNFKTAIAQEKNYSHDDAISIRRQ
jgi:hypothetical protein